MKYFKTKLHYFTYNIIRIINLNLFYLQHTYPSECRQRCREEPNVDQEAVNGTTY